MPDRRPWATNNGVYFGFGITPAKASPQQSILDEPWTVATGLPNLYPNPEDRSNRGEGHLVTIGPNGSGKTRRLLIPNLYRLTDWSMVVVDIKGELAALTAAYRAAQPGHRVIVVDPFGVMPQNYPHLVEKFPFLKSSGFNPLSALDPKSDDFPDNAMVLAEALIRVEGNEPHWSQSAQDLVAALIMYVRIDMPETGSLAEVRALLGQPAVDFRASVRAMMKKGIEEECEELTIKAGRFSELTGDNKELNGVISTALTQTRWLDSRPVKADLVTGSFDFSTLKETPSTVYLILPPRYLATHSTWLRVLITSCLMSLLRSIDDQGTPVMFMLDEFAQLGQMQVIENNMALMRGYGVKLWLILQDLSQIQSLYEKRWESFIGNAGVVQSFAPQDVTTRDYLSKLSGQRLYWLKTGGSSDTMNTGAQLSQSKGTSESVQYMAGPAFWPQGLGAMDQGRAVLFSRGKSVRTWLPDPEDENDELKLRQMLREVKSDITGVKSNVGAG
jgi:type IV secretion system protein VirD4